MNLEIMDLITLEDNKKYVVANTMIYDNKNYYLLVDENDSNNIKICYFDNDDFMSVEDNDEIFKLLFKFNPSKVLNNFSLDSTNIES